MRKGRESSKHVCILLLCIMWNCKYVTICSVFLEYKIKMENLNKNKIKKKQNQNIESVYKWVY